MTEREYAVTITWPNSAPESVVLMASDFNHAYTEALAEFEGATIISICDVDGLRRLQAGQWASQVRYDR